MLQECGKDYGATIQHNISILKELSCHLKTTYSPRTDKKEKEHKKADASATLPSPTQSDKTGLKIKRKASMERNMFFKLHIN